MFFGENIKFSNFPQKRVFLKRHFPEIAFHLSTRPLITDMQKLK
jgi:hypothetical protein